MKVDTTHLDVATRKIMSLCFDFRLNGKKAGLNLHGASDRPHYSLNRGGEKKVITTRDKDL